MVFLVVSVQFEQLHCLRTERADDFFFPSPVQTFARHGFAFGFATAAFAVGDNNDDTNPPPKTQTTKTCTGGKVWDKAKKECVNPKKSSFNDDDLYKFAREFAYLKPV